MLRCGRSPATAINALGDGVLIPFVEPVQFVRIVGERIGIHTRERARGEINEEQKSSKVSSLHPPLMT